MRSLLILALLAAPVCLPYLLQSRPKKKGDAVRPAWPQEGGE